MCTIGTDPELLLRIEQRLSAKQAAQKRLVMGPDDTAYLTTTIIAQSICPEIVQYKHDTAGSLGRDGGRWLLELRPTPSISPAEIVRRTGTLMEKTEEVIRKRVDTVIEAGTLKSFTLNIGSYDENAGGIGGHFHAGKSGRNDLNTYENIRICLGLSLLWSLEDYQSGLRRRSRGYGAVDDMRAGAGYKTTEFRSPSSDWLARPSLAKAALGYFRSLAMKTGELWQDRHELLELRDKGVAYWGYKHVPEGMHLDPEEITRLTSAQRGKYLDDILKGVKKLVNKEDLNTLTFFADKLEGIRDKKTKLIRLDSDKWRAAATCVD